MEKNKFSKRKKWLALFVVLIATGMVGFYFYESYYYPSTDDAYVNANIAYISSQIEGQVSQVFVQDHQDVKAGDPLLNIDSGPFEASLNQVRASLAVARAQYQADQEQVRVSVANLADAEAKLQLTVNQTRRTLDLLPKGYVSQDDADQAVANLKSAKATLAADQATLLQAKQNLIAQDNEIKANQALLKTAQLNLGYTMIKSPVDGIVSNLSLRPGMVVTAGSQLFAIVDQQGFWVDTNFQETQLKRIHPGQSAKVELDMYPGIVFHGVVGSISAADGSTFSLLPPENATGNWVKVTQRFTVKVLILEDDTTRKYPLRVGSSAKVTINTASI